MGLGWNRSRPTRKVGHESDFRRSGLLADWPEYLPGFARVGGLTDRVNVGLRTGRGNPNLGRCPRLVWCGPLALGAVDELTVFMGQLPPVFPSSRFPERPMRLVIAPQKPTHSPTCPLAHLPTCLPASLRRPPAVDDDIRPGDETGFFQAEMHRERGDLRRLTESAHGDP